jgi:hypothetical protein
MGVLFIHIYMYITREKEIGRKNNITMCVNTDQHVQKRKKYYFRSICFIRYNIKVQEGEK